MINIFLISTNYNYKDGGGSVVLLDLINSLNKSEYKVTLITSERSNCESIPEGINIIKLDFSNKFKIQTYLKLRKIIKSNKSAILHVHDTKGLPFGFFSSIGLKVKKVYTEHQYTKDFRLKSFLLDMIYSIWMFVIYYHFNYIIGVSNAVCDFVKSRILFNKNKVFKIYNAVDYSGKIVNHEKKKITNILTIGNFNWTKDYPTLIKIVENMDKMLNFKIHIVGAGDLKSKIFMEIQNNGLLKYFKFYGQYPIDTKFLTRFDIYVQTSRSESFGLAVAEAMSVGIPVVCFNTGALCELVRNGYNGYLIDKRGDYVEYFAAKLEILIKDHCLRKIFGKNGKSFVSKFNRKIFVANINSFYRKVSKS